MILFVFENYRYYRYVAKQATHQKYTSQQLFKTSIRCVINHYTIKSQHQIFVIDWFEFNLWQNKFCFALLVLYFPFTKFKYRKKDDSGFGLSREWYEQEIEKEKNCKPFRLVQSTLLFFYQRSFSCHFIFCAIRNLSIYWHMPKQVFVFRYTCINF